MTISPLRIALAGYDRRELRVRKRYLEEEGSSITCDCFWSGEKLIRVLQQGQLFDVLILCGELTDMTKPEFLSDACMLEQRPTILVLDEDRRHSDSVLWTESEDGVFCTGQIEMRNLLRELYRLPGQQGQEMERRCKELYESWGLKLPDANAAYLTCAVSVVYNNSQKMAIRKEILQTVSQQFNVSVSAVDSGLRRLIDQLEEEAPGEWTAFKKENGFAVDRPTTGKLIYAVKNHLQRQKES